MLYTRTRALLYTKMDISMQSRAATQKQPSAAFQASVASSAHRAAEAARKGLTSEEAAIVGRYLAARSKLRRVAEAQATAAKANAVLFGDKAPQSSSAAVTAAKAAIREYMQEEGLDVLELQPGHVVRMVAKRGTGSVKPESFIDAATSIDVDAVRSAMLRVLSDAATAMEKHAKSSSKPRRARGKVDKRLALFDTTQDAVALSALDNAAETAQAGNEETRADRGGTVGTSAASVASSARSSVASSVASAISDSVKRVQDRYGRATGVNVDKVLQMAVTDADCAATVGALEAESGARASLLHKHTEGDVDIATALAEALYTVINPAVNSMSICKTVPKADDALRIGDFPSNASPKLAAARRVIVESRAPKPKPPNDVQGVGGATGGGAAASGAAAPPKPSSGTEEARKTLTELSAAVSDIVKKRGVDADGNAEHKLPIKMRDADGTNTKIVHLSAKDGVTTVRKFTWTTATRALRYAAASVLMDNTDIDPDLPCAEMLSKNADVLPAITDRAVLIKVLQAVKTSVETFEAAHTVKYSSATVHKRGTAAHAPAPQAATASLQATAQSAIGGKKRPASDPEPTSTSAGAAAVTFAPQPTHNKKARPAFATKSGKQRPAFATNARNKD